MTDAMKYRLIGIAVIIAVAAIVIPIILDENGFHPLPQRRVLIPKEPSEANITKLQNTIKSRRKALESVEEIDRTNFSPQARTPKTVRRSRPTPQAFAIQVASLTNMKRAQALAKMLRDKGFAAYVQETTGPNGQRVSRLLVGPETNEQSAKRLVKTIEEKTKITGAMVVRYTHRG